LQHGTRTNTEARSRATTIHDGVRNG